MLTYAGSSVTEAFTSLAYLGQLTGFQTNDAALSCLEKAAGLGVWVLATSGNGSVDLVEATTPEECVTAAFTFEVPAGSTGTGSGTGPDTSGTGPDTSGTGTGQPSSAGAG